MKPISYERSGSVRESIKLLRREWAANLDSIGAAFDFGVPAATSIDDLFGAFNVELQIVPPFVQTTADDIAYRWRPRFSCENVDVKRTLRVPADYLTAHRTVMASSYLLRASADSALKWVVPDRSQRNSFIRDEVDNLMFGDISRFRRRLSDFGSLEAVHQADIPLQLVGGYLAKYLPSASLESFFAATPYNGVADGLVAPVLSPLVRQVGRGVALFDQMQGLRSSGRFSFNLPSVQHVVDKVRRDVDRIYVGVSRPLADIVKHRTGEPLVALNKTVVWSCSMLDFQRIFSRPLFALH